MSDKEIVSKIRKVIEEYHYALDLNAQGMLANLAVSKIESILEMPWKEKEEKNKRGGK